MKPKMKRPSAPGRGQLSQQQKYGTSAANLNTTTQASNVALIASALKSLVTARGKGTEGIPANADHYFLGDTCAKQRARLLAALKRGPVDAAEARKRLDVPAPQERARDLRLLGYNIQAKLIWMDPGDGKKRTCVPEYRLIADGYPPSSRTAGSQP